MNWKIYWEESDGRKWQHRKSYKQHEIARTVRSMMRKKRSAPTVTKITLVPDAPTP